LREDASDNYDDEDVGRGVCELVVARERHLERQAERLDEHDGDGARGGADGDVYEGVLAAVLGRDLVDHEDGEDGDEEAVEEEACIMRQWATSRIAVKRAHLAESQDAISRQPTAPPCPAAHAAR
jgi:hypothetical protein